MTLHHCDVGIIAGANDNLTPFDLTGAQQSNVVAVIAYRVAQGAQRDSNHVLHLSQLNVHLRGHVEAQDPLRVRYLEAGIIEDGVIHFFRRRQNAFQFTS